MENRYITSLMTEDFRDDLLLWREVEAMEVAWKKSNHFFEGELKKVFPEAHSVIIEKIYEWQKEYKMEESLIKDKLRIINQKSALENQWFWKAVVKHLDIPRLVEIQNQIKRLKRLDNLYSGASPPNKNWLSEADIQRAESVPIESVLSIKLKRVGKNLIGSCPLHNEKTPSFTIYLKTNTFHCFGCGRNGNIIILIRLLHSLTFVEAVKYLLNL